MVRRGAFDCTGWKQGPMTSFCEHGNETGFHKYGEFLDQLSKNQYFMGLCVWCGLFYLTMHIFLNIMLGYLCLKDFSLQQLWT
jgi:hypothetical protein